MINEERKFRIDIIIIRFIFVMFVVGSVHKNVSSHNMV